MSTAAGAGNSMTAMVSLYWVPESTVTMIDQFPDLFHLIGGEENTLN